MARGISSRDAERAINVIVREREMRRKEYADDPEECYQKVREMNQVLDVLRWSEKLLEVPGNERRDGDDDRQPDVVSEPPIGMGMGPHGSRRY